MSYPRLDENVSTAALTTYAGALHALALEHAAAMSAIPSLTGDLQRLKDETGALVAAAESWTSRSNAKKAALILRNEIFAAAVVDYLKVRDWFEDLIPASGDVLRPLAGSCPPRSLLKVTAAPEALTNLANGVETHPELFASVGVGAADVALLRAHHGSVVAAIDAHASAARAHKSASKQRDNARIALVGAARLVEGYLERRGSEETRGELETIRSMYLPRRTRKSAKKADPTAV